MCYSCGVQGLGVVCNKQEGFDDGDFVVEFFGEVHTDIPFESILVLRISFSCKLLLLSILMTENECGLVL